ncbi:uncharacterized protein EV420DRAFT_1267567 [Desarmillaria tabescens]|uniref:Citrate transporter-like domain-containing protein n=1 Tax=Armillaria tabescens TaxID=1929756 RepID=A0AA39TQP8_ARMTA|nr:uncharacterized protein EV420DRAFT_1267567 [Desarmillaria tabescens]KAK0460694.1 hypothetical protein EV420DRAFT_1267567 [Desarmillaria tabescens]
MITRFSIVTLIIFILSITFVIYPVSFTLRIPYLGRKKIPINLATAPILAIAILWASQCLGATQIRDGIVGTDGVKPYNILILFFTLAYMAITLDISGLLQAAAFWVSNQGGSSGWKLFFYFYVMLTLTSGIVGNDPVILSGTVFLVYYTKVTGLEPMPWLISEFAAANTASMILFVGNPTNVVICEGFNIINAAFTAYTILPFLGCSVFCFIALAFQFRDSRHIPRKLSHVGHLNVRGVLRDPFGALAGSLILGSCLIVIIIVSFFHIDVWKISLPFACAKLIFDFVWDHIRFVRKHRGSGDKSGSSDEPPVEGADADPMLSELRRAMSMSSEPGNSERDSTSASGDPTLVNSTNLDHSRREDTIPSSASCLKTQNTLDPKLEESQPQLFASQRLHFHATHRRLATHFPTFFTALPRLPFGLVPFAFSQFILIEALQHQGWIEVFANWLVRASHRSVHSSIWLVGVLGVVLCNCAGTNIGATILLTKVVRAANFPPDSTRAAGIALAVASNIGAVSFTFSASLAGLLWTTILSQKDIHIKQREFAFWNLLPILVMTAVGLGIVSAEMAVLY